MTFAIKAEIRDPRVKALAFTAQKTMYGGKHIAQGDTVFVFASENEDGCGLMRAASSSRPKRLRKNVASPGKRRG
jgi:hypothetical protein